MSFLRLLSVPVALFVGAVATFVATGPASANADAANVVLEVFAKRNILSTSGWSSVDVQIRNDGSLPAAGVTVALTLPDGLNPSGAESTSDWECDWLSPAMTCTHIGDLAPGDTKRVMARTVSVAGPQAGAALEVSATATTASAESSTADNMATKTIHIVATGEVRGVVFNDLNADGIRQANEPGATDVGMSIRSQDDEDGYGSSNTYNGTHRYEVPAKRYQISSTLIRNNWRFTTPDVGSDATDSDLRMVSETQYNQTGESPVFRVTEATPTVIDLGVIAAYRPSGITPSSGVQGTTPVVKLTGAWFSESLEVKLTRAGADPIVGTVSNVATDRKSMDVAFPLGQAAAGAWTLTVDRQYGPHAEVANAFVITAQQLRATAAPSVTGTVAVGSTVKATTGTWTPAATAYTYQWSANGIVIPGATASSLSIPPSALGKRLTVKVTASRAGHAPAVASSAATVTVAKGNAPAVTRQPSISGTVAVGATVRATPGTWLPTASGYRYQWLANGVTIKGATGASLMIPASVLGKRLAVRITAVRSGHHDGVAGSPVTSVAAKGKAATATRKPTISGTARVGTTLTANTGAWSPKADSYRYEWRLNGKLINGASARTLKVKSAWLNQRITVTVIARKAGHADGRATSTSVKIRR